MLLVRNRAANFWYAPGGGWKYDDEELHEGAVREVLEEVGIQVRITRLVYVRTFRPPREKVQLELFWIAYPGSIRLPRNHVDRHGLVEEAGWFTRMQLRKLKVFPRELKEEFWQELDHRLHNPYLTT
jgi:8-oxo-dGTP diphosphatase